MCGRFNQSKKAEEIRKFYGVTSSQVDWEPNYNVAPTDTAPVIVEPKGGSWEIRLMRFGQMNSRDGKKFLLINRQSEKLAGNKALTANRCIIPATGFYEWQKLPDCKQPWFFTPHSGEFFSFAGLWRETGQGPGFTILTTHANDVVAPVHNRMPVILGHNAVGIWLSEESDITALSELLAPFPDALMQSVKVSQRVNNARNKDASCQNSI